MNREEMTREKIQSLMRDQRVCVLSTSRQNRPYANLVAFAVDDDLKRIVFATPRNTRKYGNLCANPHVALIVDSRSNRQSDFQDGMAVTVIGRARELEGAIRKSTRSIYVARHPYLADFVQDDSCALFEITVERCILVEGLQKVSEYSP